MLPPQVHGGNNHNNYRTDGGPNIPMNLNMSMNMRGGMHGGHGGHGGQKMNSVNVSANFQHGQHGMHGQHGIHGGIHGGMGDQRMGGGLGSDVGFIQRKQQRAKLTAPELLLRHQLAGVPPIRGQHTRQPAVP